MKENNILGGFDAVFDSLTPNGDMKLKGVEVVQDPNDNLNDTVSVETELDDDDIIPFQEPPIELEKDITNDEPVKPDAIVEDEPADVDDAEKEQVLAFFDAVAEQVGWNGIGDEEKPKSVEDFVSYMKTAVEESSKPQYANDDIAALDEFVRNGGDINSFFNTVNTVVDLENIDLTNEDSQRYVVGEFLKEKGFNDTQIKRKLEKYEDADLLEDEANDAIEFLKESKEEKKKALLEAQTIAYEGAIKEQQKFYNNVVDQIEAIVDIRGIKIPKEDKQGLKDFIFKVESDGKTQYQKKYAESSKNLIESAYFTWKGDKFVENAKKSGETSATERLKNSLRTNKVGGSKQTINNSSPTPLWAMASQQLRGNK
jgi:hypothetical protein